MIIKRNRQKNILKQQPPQVQPPVVNEPQFVDIPQETPLEDIKNTELQNLEEPSFEEVVQEEPKKEIQEDTSDIFADFNFDSIEFNQRAERRRGDRRRGYRRIDERNMISRAQEEAIEIKEQATKEGYQNGLKEAQEAIDSLKESLSTFFTCKDEVYEQLSADILDISLKVAEKIIRKEVSLDKSVLDGVVKEAMKNLAKGENKIILKVNPMDVEYMKESVPKLLESGQMEAKMYVTADKDVEEGSVIIETSNGVIDANIRTQLEVIKEAFKQI